MFSLLAFARAETGAEFERRIQDAIEVGDSKRLAEIVQPFVAQPGAPEYLGARACALLGVALVFDQPARAYEFFTAASKTPSEYVRATFWRVESQLLMGNPGLARALAHELALAHPEGPAAPYARGRIALYDYRRLPADATAAREAIESEMKSYLARCSGTRNHASKDFDPRFVSLAIDWHLERNDLEELARAHEEMLLFRPKNLRLIRTQLCLEVTRLDSQIRLLSAAAAILPPDEMARWQQRRKACALDHADPEYATQLLGLADLADTSAAGGGELVPGRLFFLQRAAEALGPDDPRLAATAQRFAALAASSRQGAATAALALIDKVRRDWEVSLPLEAGLELRLCLTARDYTRALPLAVRTLPAERGNHAWLRAAWPALERGSPAVRREVADALLRLKPDDAFSRLVALRAYRGADDPLPRFAAVFEGGPFLGTLAEDWASYREALVAQARENDFLDGTTDGAAKAEKHFESTVDRWQKASPYDVTLMEQVALRAIRQANARTSPETVREALSAVNAAITLGSTETGILQSQPKLATVHNGYIEMERAQSAADARAREAFQKLAAERAREEADARASQATARERSEDRLEKLRLQASYVSGIRAERASLAQQLGRGGILSDGARARLARQLAETDAILANFCRTCSGLGALKGSSAYPCGSCHGTGKINPNGPGASAGMQ